MSTAREGDPHYGTNPQPEAPDVRRTLLTIVQHMLEQIERSPGLSHAPFSKEGWENLAAVLSDRAPKLDFMGPLEALELCAAPSSIEGCDAVEAKKRLDDNDWHEKEFRRALRQYWPQIKAALDGKYVITGGHAVSPTPNRAEVEKALIGALVEKIRYIGVKSGVDSTVYGAMCLEVRAIIEHHFNPGWP